MGQRRARAESIGGRKVPWRVDPSAALVATAYTFYAATAVFVVTYVLISLRNVRRFPIERPAVAMLGGAPMRVLGILSPPEAIAAINLVVDRVLLTIVALVSGPDPS